MTTRYVYPGDSIAGAILASSPLDTVVLKSGTHLSAGVVLNKPLSLVGEPGTILQASSPGQGWGVQIAANNCWVDELDIREYSIGVGTDWRNPGTAKFNDAKITDCRIYKAQNGIWVNGDRWLILGVDYDKNYSWSGGDSNYNTVFGRDHIIRGCYAHNTIIGNGATSDIMPGHVGMYDTGPGSHLDFVQHWNNNGEVLTNLLVENNIITDFIDGVFIADEAGSGSVRGVIVRNNVFIGTNFTAVPGQLNGPSHCIAGGKGTGVGDLIVENNTIYNCALGVTATGGTRPTVRNNIFAKVGTTFDFRDGTTSPMCAVSGNLLWQTGSYPGPMGDFGSVTGDPQFISIASIPGVDGLIRTADDGYVARALIAADKGASFVNAAPPPSPPPPTIEPTPDMATQAEMDAAQAADDARMDAIEARLTALELWRNAQPKTRRSLRGWDGKAYYGRVEP